MIADPALGIGLGIDGQTNVEITVPTAVEFDGS